MRIRFISATAIAGCVVLALTGCGGGDSATSQTATVTETKEVIATETTAEAPPAQTETEATASPDGTTTELAPVAVMPNVVCMNLQAAQDAIQDAGVFYSRSNDATGQGRSQIMDRNWIVVAQNPPAGTPISEGDAMLSAVKIGEPSQC